MDIRNIMHENFDMVLNRDKNLNKITKMSSDLKDNSKKVSLINIIQILFSNESFLFLNYSIVLYLFMNLIESEYSSGKTQRS